MGFVESFFWHAVLAAVVCIFWFTLPGLLVTRLLGFDVRLNKSLSGLFLAPALGMSTYGSFSLLITWIVGFSTYSVIASWLSFQLLCLTLYFKRMKRVDLSSLFEIPQWRSFSLLVAVAVWSLLPVLNIFPFVHQEGLYVNYNIFDHLKIAIVDSIAREGMPVLNPFYAPGGERIQLIYYYGWHFLVAQVKLLGNLSGWQAEVAFTWFTSSAVIAMVMAVAIRLCGKARAGVFVLLLGSTKFLYQILPYIFGPDIPKAIGLVPVIPLDLLLAHLSWAPQHVFSGLCGFMLIFFAAQLLADSREKWMYAGVIGLTAAIGFSASIWVGGIALAFSLPFFLCTIALLRFPFSRYRELTGPACLAVILCILFSMPVLTAATSGPTISHSFPLRIDIYDASALFGRVSSLEKVGQVVLYWIQFLPLSLGVVYVFGFLSLLAYLPRSAETKAIKSLSFAGIVAYLVAILFMQSAIGNNDFGWRTVIVPILWLMTWGAIALSDIQTIQPCGGLQNWRERSILVRYAGLVIPLAYAGMTVGIISTVNDAHLPGPRYSEAQHDLSLHKDFFHFRNAWEEVRTYTRPNALVQINPATYSKTLTRWEGPASLALFADRPTSFAEPESVKIFAHPYSVPLKRFQHGVVTNLFSSSPRKDFIAYAHGTLKIEALVVDKRDQVWSSTALEDSGFYRLVSQKPKYKIYLAVQ